MTLPGLLGLSHIGFAVPNIEEFQRTWGAVLGITDWLVRDLAQPADALQLRGGIQPAAFSRAAFARVADTAIELVEPHSGQTRTSAWLAERGPGIHHLAFWVENLPAAVAALGETIEVSYSPISVRPGMAVLTTEPVEGFWAYTEVPATSVPWCLELLDIRYAETVRAAFGNHLCYPGPVGERG
jgi:methylmalonyl-CoA/ethylmalonyl-CoA epimerase